jgi:hypothetical protein
MTKLRDQQPECATRQCNQQIFRHELPHQLAAAGPDCQPDCDLTFSRAAPTQDQVRDVGARDQERNHHDGEQHTNHQRSDWVFVDAPLQFSA